MRSKLLVIELVCCVALVPVFPVRGAEPETIATGSALSALGETPPAPPAGYESSDAVMQALQRGQIRIVNLFAPTPPGIIIRTNVEYGRAGGRSLTLDLYSPENLKQPVPGLLLVHGGGWKGGKKEDYRIYGEMFAAKGYVVASVGYRLSDDAKYPAAVHDVKAAVRWMRSQAEAINVIPDRIGIAGGSAGGHLALLIGYSSDVSALEGDCGHAGVSSRVQAVVDIYGPVDLTTDFVRENDTASSLTARFFGVTYATKPDLYREASPIVYVTQDDPPTLILHGTVDDIVPINQSDMLAARLKEIGVPYIYDRLPGWPHAMDLSQEVNDRCVWFMERFFDRYLKQAP